MKKQLLLLCVLSFSIVALKAQTNVYHPFPNDSMVWLQERATGFTQFNFFIDEIMGDTAIGSVSYKKMFRSNTWSTSPYTSSTPLYSPALPVFYSGAWRQDIPAKKVYSVYPGDTAEHILYDFNLSVGDTIHLSYYDTVWVTGIDSALVGGVYHRRFLLGNTSCVSDNICLSPLVEGLGFEEGPGNHYYDDFSGWGQQLLCFSYQGTSIYPNASTPCELTLGISDLSGEKINISLMPNPTLGVVNLSIGCTEKYSVEVTSDAGTLLYQKKDEQFSGSVVDLSGYAPGVYLISITDTKGNRATKRVVKQ